MKKDIKIDGRSSEDILSQAKSMAPYYTPLLDTFDEKDQGVVLLKIFSQMVEDVVKRLDQVPGKNFIAFLDMQGMGLQPRQASRVPLTFTVSEGANKDIYIPEKTPVGADATDMRPELIFEIEPGRGFLATPSVLKKLYSENPKTDEIFEHIVALEQGNSTELFADGRKNNLQEHIFYIGHGDLFNIGGSAKIKLIIESAKVSAILILNKLANLDLFSLEPQYYKKYLKDGLVSDVLRTAFENNKVPLTSEAMITKKDGKHWEIKDRNKIYRIENTGTTDTIKIYDSYINWEYYGEKIEITKDGEEIKKEGWHPLTTLTPERGEIPKHMIPVIYVLGVGEIFNERLKKYGITTIGELIKLAPGELAQKLATNRRTAENIIETAKIPIIDKSRPLPSLTTDALSSEALKLLGGSIVLWKVEDGEIKEHEINKIKSRWIRCRIKKLDTLDDLKLDKIKKILSLEKSSTVGDIIAKISETSISSVEVGILPYDEGGNLLPDMALYNDVPLDLTGISKDKPLYPFGDIPSIYCSFYIASHDAFSKKDAEITLKFMISEGEPSDNLRLSWEYWNGDGWIAIKIKTNDTENFTADDDEKTVIFTCPNDFEMTGVGGHENYWVRVRIVAGDYGKVEFVETDGTIQSNTKVSYLKADGSVESVKNMKLDTTGTWQRDTVDIKAPGFTKLSISYEEPGRISDHIITYNNLDYSVDLIKYPAFASDFKRWFGDKIHVSWEIVRGLNLDDLKSKYPAIAGKIEEYGLDWDILRDMSWDRIEIEDISDKPFRPFEGFEEDTQSLYLGFDRRLKSGPINIFFSLEEREYPEGFIPRFRWEYCSDTKGDNWAKLDVMDETGNLTKRGILSLVAPDDMSKLKRFDKELYWIRARLTGEEFEPIATGASQIETPGEEKTLREEILGSSDGRTPGQEYFFSRHPIEIWVDELSALSSEKRSELMEEIPSAVSEVRDIDGNTTEFWVKWNCVGNFNESTDEKRHYVLCATKGSVRFGDGKKGRMPPGGENNIKAIGLELQLQPCEETLSIDCAVEKVARYPPSLKGIYLNTTWAFQTETLSEEILGSSDGISEQKYFFSKRPVINEGVWVNELSSLSSGERGELMEKTPSAVSEAKDVDGNTIGFWVKWKRVDDFLDSKQGDRHYVLDSTMGTVNFGDGINGRVPPIGRDNIKANYQTGGGMAGNVKAGEIASLKSSLPFIDGVTNPEMADGGADTEALDELLMRGPQHIKNRGHAVMREDFEWIALEASRKIARAKCIPGLDKECNFKPGWVTIIIVPQSSEKRPIPSVGLKGLVMRYVEERCAGALIVPKRLVVKGPGYLGVSISATLIARSIDRVPLIEKEAPLKVRTFLHPLTGGNMGGGWEFGRLPCLSDFYQILEGIDGVDHVDELSMVIKGAKKGEKTVITPENEFYPQLKQYNLVFSGEHDITATIRGDDIEP